MEIVGTQIGSRHRSINRIILGSNGVSVRLRHQGEAVYIVAEGVGALLTGDGSRLPLRRHSMVYVPPRTEYSFSAQTPMEIFGGPCPPDGAPAGTLAGGTGVKVLDAERDGPPIPMISKQARLVVWPGMGATVATMNFVVLEPGEENHPHAHESSDDTIVILEGKGTIDNMETGRSLEFSTGDVVHVLAGVPHKVKADRGVRIVSAGGPCPPDTGMLRAMGVID